MDLESQRRIIVLVGGSIVHGGQMELPLGATVQDVLTRAGGFEAQGNFRPGSQITLRRPFGWDDNPEREIFQWDISDPADGEWWQFKLEDRDGLIFSFNVNESES